jgi:hypothetical protein
MDDRTYLLGKVAALEAALDAAITAHPEPSRVVSAVARAMATYLPERCPRDRSSFAEGWMAIITPLLTDQACRASAAGMTPWNDTGSLAHAGRIDGSPHRCHSARTRS